MTSIGIDSLPEQESTRRLMHGVAFNLLVVGPAGIGKTTLINSLFDFDYGDMPDLEREIVNVGLKIKEYEPQNKFVKLKFTIIETKGYGVSLEQQNDYQTISNYIMSKFENFENELEVEGSSYNDIQDDRIHCCIYLISPIGSGLRPIDLVTMKRLHKIVCLVPVIAKSDILDPQEKKSLIEKVREQITLNQIEIYSAPDSYHLPLAVSASNSIKVEEGKRRRCRECPWGPLFIDDHSDFPKLRDLVFRSQMLGLIEETDRKNYEWLRTQPCSKELEALLLED